MSSTTKSVGPAAIATPTAAPRSNMEEYFSSITPHTRAFEASDGVVHMAVSGSNMWVSLADGGIEVREVHTGILQHTFSPAPRPSSSTRIWCILSVRACLESSAYSHISGCAISNDEEQVWVGLSTGTIEVYHGVKYILLRQLRKHISGVYCLASCGNVLAGRDEAVYSGSSDFLVAQWQACSGQLLRIFQGHSNYVRCLYAEGAAMVSGSDDRSVRVWDCESGETLRVGGFHAATGGVSAMCRVGVNMWSGDDGGTIVIWHVQDCIATRTFHPHTGRITALGKIGSRVYSGSADGTIGFYNAEDGAMIRRLNEHAVGGSRVMAVQAAVEVDRHYVWSCAADNTIRCWHHDEHIPITARRERLNDMCWYYATQQPYREANDALLEAHSKLLESVLLSRGTDGDVRTYVGKIDADKRSIAVKCWDLNFKMHQASQRVAQAEKERRDLDGLLQEKGKTLQVVQSNLKAVSEALANARATCSTTGAGGLSVVAASPAVMPISSTTATTLSRLPVGTIQAPSAPPLVPTPTVSATAVSALVNSSPRTPTTVVPALAPIAVAGTTETLSQMLPSRPAPPAPASVLPPSPCGASKASPSENAFNILGMRKLPLGVPCATAPLPSTGK